MKPSILTPVGQSTDRTRTSKAAPVPTASTPDSASFVPRSSPSSLPQNQHSPAMPEVIEQHFAEIANQRKSHLEDQYGQFYDPAIKAADAAHPGAGSLMRNLNRYFAICNGMATVMRIASGNDTLIDFHDPDDADSEPPLSRAAISSLTTMTAAICEWISDDISRTSDSFNGRGEKA